MATEAKAKKTYTPNELAKICGVDPKRVRAYLRANHPRTNKEKNSSWSVSLAVAREVKQHFAPSKPKATKAKATKKPAADAS